MHFFPLIRTKKATIIMSLIMVLPMVLMTLGVMSDRVMALVLPVYCFLFYPVLIMISALWGGLLSMVLGLLSVLSALYVSFSFVGAGLGLVYFVPVIAAFIYVVEKQVPFFKALGVLALVMLVCQVACALILRVIAGGDIATAAGQGAVELISASPMCDLLLLSLYQTGSITIKNDLLLDFFIVQGGQIVGLTDMGRAEMLLSVRSMVSSIALTLPSMIVSNAITLSTAGLGLGLYIGRVSTQRADYMAMRKKEIAAQVKSQREAKERGEAPPEDTRTAADYKAAREKAEQQMPAGFPDLKMPQLQMWFLPRGAGLKVGLLALGYLPLMFSTSLTGATIGQLFVTVFTAIYSIQGMAALNFLQRKAGVRSGGRKATLIILYVLFQSIFLWLGVLDQVLNFRKLRPPLGANQTKEDK